MYNSFDHRVLVNSWRSVSPNQKLDSGCPKPVSYSFQFLMNPPPLEESDEFLRWITIHPPPSVSISHVTCLPRIVYKPEGTKSLRSSQQLAATSCSREQVTIKDSRVWRILPILWTLVHWSELSGLGFVKSNWYVGSTVGCEAATWNNMKIQTYGMNLMEGILEYIRRCFPDTVRLHCWYTTRVPTHAQIQSLYNLTRVTAWKIKAIAIIFNDKSCVGYATETDKQIKSIQHKLVSIHTHSDTHQLICAETIYSTLRTHKHIHLQTIEIMSQQPWPKQSC